jgi:hypothetical protein
VLEGGALVQGREERLEGRQVVVGVFGRDDGQVLQ